LANVSWIFGFTWICPIPWNWYSTGSSIVDDVLGARVEVAQGRVERGGLPGAGRAGDEEDAAGPERNRSNVARSAGSSPCRRARRGRSPVEQPQHCALAEGGGDGGDADVDLPAAETDLDPTVLGQAALRDVEPRHDLDPGDGRGVPLPGGGDHRVEDAVDPVADHQLLFRTARSGCRWTAPGSRGRGRRGRSG